MKLVIVESPSKAKTIEKYLGEDYTVRASVGHVRDLPKSNKAAIDIPGGFIPHYEISKGKEKVIKELTDLAKKSNSVILATDPDREGEAIAWHLETLLKEKVKKDLPIKRAAFHEITKDAVSESLKHPREIDTNLRKAQEARRVLDRLVGYDLSGIIWKKVRYGLSAGRVQSPALRILCEREREIRAFIPEAYFVIEADLKPSSQKESLTFTCVDEPRDKKEVDRILEEGKKGQWLITNIKESEQKRSPRAPFTTSTLQQTASTRLGYSPGRTMQIAQKLYEAGYITYMRTDSTNLGTQAIGAIASVIKKEYGENYLQTRIYKTKSKNAQEAHEAIRPTDVFKKFCGTTPEQKSLYSLIWERAVSSQMADAKVMRTKITVNIKQNISPALPDFTINGQRLVFDGWLKAEESAKGEDVILPKFSQGDSLSLTEMRDIAKETQPPNRYTEAGLIKELEERGIGRPSTYASIMKTLEEREYVRKEGKTLFPTDTGEVVSGFLEEHFTSYISDTFTAEMEDKLDDIAEGKREYVKTLEEFYTPFLKEVKSKEKLEKATTIEEADPSIRCPKCGGSMVVKLARTGKFLSCAKYPDCDGARTIEGKELEGPKETGEMCPKCGEKKGKSGGGKLVIREGRFGTFISCSRYPKCKFIKEDEEEKKKRMTNVTCPVCNKGKMSERKGRFGIFYSCSDYPDCKYAIKSKPTGNLCPMCKSLMMEGTKTIPERCSDKKCPNHNPHKLKK